MFDLNSIRILNFKSFSGTHFFIFPKEPGLYYLAGENLYNPRLGANGAGKTSFIDAVQWCLHGSSTRGLKASDIITWGKKKTIVEVNLKIKSKTKLICRGQRPNFLELDGKTITQEELNDFLKLDKESFNYAIIIPQFNNSFFDLTPTAKLNLFSQLMNLDFWLEKSIDANDISKELDKNINAFKYSIHNTKTTIENINFDISILKDKKKVFIEEQTKIYKHLKIQRLEASNEDKELKGKIDKLIKQIKKDKSKQNKTKDKIHTINTDITKIDKEIAILDYTLLNLNIKLDDLKCETINIKKLIGNTCPMCHQKVNKGYVKEHLKPIKIKIQNLKDTKAENIKNTKQLELTWDTFKRSLKFNVKKLNNTKDKLKIKRLKQDKLEYIWIITTKHYENLTKEMKTEKERINPFSDLLKEKLTEKIKQKDILVELRIEKLQIEKDYETINFWGSGFKRVRLYIIEQTLRKLEIEINNNFSMLGLDDWSVIFDIERETKAGGISRGFSVFIQSPKHDKPVRWEAWSGGETQRLRIAGDLGLANLILEHNGLESAIEFHDEPSEHMTTEGIDDMLETLYHRAHYLNKKIWLVDHQTLNFGGFSGVLKITMDKKGNSHLLYK